MLQFIIQQWKNRRGTIALMVIGFFVGSLVMSLGVSASVASYQYITDQQMGDPAQQVDLSLTTNGRWHEQTIDELVEQLSTFGEVQLLSMNSEAISGTEQKAAIVPVLLKRTPDWHVPLVAGRYLTKADRNAVVIGKRWAEQLHLTVGQSITLASRSLQIVGITGRNGRETSWEHALYVPWKTYRTLYPNALATLDVRTGITFHLASGKAAFLREQDALQASVQQQKMTLTHKAVATVDRSALRNAVTITIVATVLVFTIALLNIGHLMLYWIGERQREIGIMKALGANARYIGRTVVAEVVVIALLGGALAIATQFGATALFTKWQLPLHVTVVNMIGAFVVSLLFGVLAAIIPARTAMRVEPVHAINRL